MQYFRAIDIFSRKKKNIQYGLKKSWGLLQEYWISLFTLFIPLAMVGGWKLTMKSLIINLFAFGPNLNWNAWYVYFFILCMLVMPFINEFFKFNSVINVSIAVIVPFIIKAAIYIFIPNYYEITLLQVLFSCMHYFSPFLLGYLMAKYDIVSKIRILWLLGGGCMIGVIVLRLLLLHINTFGFNIDVVYAPAFVIGTAKFIDGIPIKFTKVLDVLGKYSTGMWFFHAVFFATYVKDIFQPVMTLIKPLFLMYVWLVVLSLFGAVIYRKVLDEIKLLPKLMKG